jgi:thiosulfate dehydrogenase [quinone] large subunit
MQFSIDSLRRDISTAYVILRVTMGVNMFFHGGTRIPHLTAFADSIVKAFARTQFPPALVAPYAYAIPFIEVVLGVLILAGIGLRYILPLSGIYMISLIVGTLFRADYLVVSEQLEYSIVFAILIALRSFNGFSLVRGR